MTTAPTASATETEVVRWTFDRINAQDLDALRSVWTAETLERFPDRTCHGADEMAAYFAEVFAAVPDVRFEVLQAGADGANVFVRWHMTGTHTGAAFGGVERTGRRIEVDGIDHFVIRDGKVVSNFVVFDQMQVARAMGLLPPDGAPADRALKAAFNAKTRAVDAVRRRR